jgi:hypothetical protein
MTTKKEENRNISVPPPANEGIVKPGDEECSNKQDCEKKEFDVLQAEDPGNQGS